MKQFSHLTKTVANILVPAILMSLLLANPALAGTAVSSFTANIKPIIEEISQGLIDLGVPLITVALMFIGYQIAFSSKTIKSLLPVIIGSLIVGAAPLLAKGLLGK